MTVIRLFTAVVPAKKAKASLAKTIAEYKKEPWGRDVRWVKPENLHLTLKYIGEVDAGKIPEIVSAIESVASEFSPFTAEFSGLTIFPGPSKPFILSAGTANNPVLEKLSVMLDKAFAGMGIPREKRKFKGHITLGRCKKTFPKSAHISDIITGTEFRVKEVILYRSILTPNGPEYRGEKKFSFLRPAGTFF